MAQNAHTLSVNMGDGNVNAGNMTNCFNTTINRRDEEAEIMRWLSPLEPNDRHQSVRADRFAGVGDWILETKDFREWRSGGGGKDDAVLFCSGNPGVGKTYLSSLVIDSLGDQEGRDDTVITGLYCDYLNQQEQTTANVIGVILKQLVARGDIPQHVRKAFQAGKRNFGGGRPQLQDLVEMLKVTIASLPPIFICIDALDEFLPQHLPELLGSLRDIVSESPKTRIFLTGRPHITEHIRRYFAKAAVAPISPNPDDIRSYLEMKLDRDIEPEAMNDGLRADILRVILEKTSDIFLLVSLHIEAILAEDTISQRRKKLEEMMQGNGLGDAYTATLTRLKAQKGNKSRLGLKVLMWVLYSERPLKVEELRHALGVELGSTDLDHENIPALRTLLASSLGLVTVEASSSTVRLVHFTLQEHLLSDSALFHTSHSTIAETCLTFLNFRCVCDLSPALDSVPTTMPLLEYASCYWGEHTREGMTENVKILALQLLARSDKHTSALIMISHVRESASIFSLERELSARGFPGLHIASFHGIAEAVAALLEMKELDVNARDGASCTPLIWAAARGHEEVVKVLLERGDVNPDLEDHHYHETALHWAAERGHEGVFKVFLEREGVNPDLVSGRDSITPLWLAAGYGRDGIVKMLLEREGVNPNRQSGWAGLTPLSRAAYRAHEGVVKIFLQREGVNPNLADTDDGRTPLANAAHKGHEGVVKILLERNDVRIDIRDHRNKTPLEIALSRGHNKIASMISERAAIKSDTTDPGSQPSLPPSARQEEESVVEMVLRGDHPNTTTANPSGHLHPHQQTPMRRKGIALRRLFSRFR